MQTVFEGFETNTERAAVETSDQYGLTIPVGHDSGRAKDGSYLMRRYRAGGTPWTVIVDRSGVVRANDFFISKKRAVATIDGLLER